MVSAYVGSNRFALLQALQKQTQEFAAENGELAVETFDGEEVEVTDIQAALQSISLFNPSKLVVVKSLSANKQAADQIEQLCSQASEGAELLIVEPKPDKRSAFYKTLKKQAVVTEFNELDERQLGQWLQDQAQARGAKLSRQDANYLVNRVGNQQMRLNSELTKLCAHDATITKQTIDLLTEPTPQNTVFELLEAVFSHNVSSAMQLYESLRQGGSQPQMILSMVTWQVHQVALVAFAGDKSLQEVAADSGMKSYPLQKSQAIARRLGAAEIKKLFTRLEALDYQLKTQSIDADEAVRNMLARIATSS